MFCFPFSSAIFSKSILLFLSSSVRCCILFTHQQISSSPYFVRDSYMYRLLLVKWLSKFVLLLLVLFIFNFRDHCRIYNTVVVFVFQLRMDLFSVSQSPPQFSALVWFLSSWSPKRFVQICCTVCVSRNSDSNRSTAVYSIGYIKAYLWLLFQSVQFFNLRIVWLSLLNLRAGFLPRLGNFYIYVQVIYSSKVKLCDH